jgi:hypothetical protein
MHSCPPDLEEIAKVKMNVPKSQVGTASERLTAVFKKPGNLTCSPDYNKNIKFLRGHTTLAIFYCSASTSDTLPKQEVIKDIKEL